MNNLSIKYYLSLIAITIIFSIATVYTAGSNVDYGFQVQKLKTQQNNLVAYSQQLTQQISLEQSIEQAQVFAQTQTFLPISQVITLNNLSQLASR